jgi:hypothetical protein
MSDPKHVLADTSLDRIRGIGAKLADRPETPEDRQRRAAFEAREAQRREEELSAICDQRGVPTEPGAREVILAPEPAVTAALEAIQGVLTWRLAQRVPRGGRQPAIAILAGRPGNGKTTALGWAVARSSKAAQFVVARLIAASPRNGWHRDAWEKWSTCDLLAIDELGREEPGENNGGVLRISALLAERYDAGLVTLCATNLDAQGFAQRYADDRLASRLRAGQFRNGGPGGCPYWHNLPDGDLRDPLFREQLLRRSA